ncbi:MAG: hypothetical protein ACOWWH_01005 [Eubacteriaceae bacterium]
MNITRTDMMKNIGNMQKSQSIKNISLANVKIVSDSDSDGVMADISNKGKKIGNIMERISLIPSTQMKEQMNEMQSAIEELNLSELDLENMSDEEIFEVANEINNVLESYKPAHVDGNALEISSMTTDEQRSFISEFKNNANSALDSIGKMEGMIEGKPPMGGRPQRGSNGQNAIEAYESSNDSNEEEEELQMIESLIEAFESDENNDYDTDFSEFYKVMGDYLGTNINE